MPRNLQKIIACCLFAVVVCGCSYVCAQSQPPKITRINLEDYGWQPVPNRRPLFGRPSVDSNLWLDHNNRVLVAFTVREGDALATRDHPARSFHILRFTPVGKMDLSVALPTNDWYRNGLYLGPDDQILARANDTLQSFSEDASDGESGSWQPLSPCPEHCVIGLSFSRRTLILKVPPPARGSDRSTYTILDVSSSPPRVVRTCSEMASMKITDQFSYRTNYDRDDDLTVRYPFCEVDHYEDFPMWGRGGGYILNDESLLKIGYGPSRPSKVDLVAVDGKVKFSTEMPKHDSIDPYKIATDERYDRFAFMVNTEEGAHPRLDISGHLVARRVLVFDRTGKQLASIPTETHYHMDSNFSLSPDGHRLAILDDGVVTLVEIQ